MMKSILPLLCAICLVVPAAGQADDPIASDPTVQALTALQSLKKRAEFGVFLKAGRNSALLADKQTLLYIKSEADRPNYGGNAAAKTRKTLWLSILQGKVKPAPSTPAAPTD